MRLAFRISFSRGSLPDESNATTVRCQYGWSSLNDLEEGGKEKHWSKQKKANNVGTINFRDDSKTERAVNSIDGAYSFTQKFASIAFR